MFYTADTSTIATRTDGTAGATVFTYDWARRQTVINPPDAFVAGTVTRTYRLDGLLATQAFPSSITETLAYDAVKRPLSISLGSAGSISQAFDRGGRVTSDSRSLTGISGDAGMGTQAFTYDALSRLAGSTGLALSRSYQYDLDGNRTRRVEGAVTTDVTYDRADQQIQQVIGGTTKTFTHDRYGNLTQGPDAASALTTYGYDEASRLTTITPPAGGQVSFTMDALDRNATRAVAGTGTTDTYGYLDATETAWQTGTGSTSLLDATGTRLAVKTGTAVAWLVFDLHGSVVALCPADSSTLTDAYRFDGWGQQVAVSGSVVNPFRYRGLLNIGADSLAGALLDMSARHYSPQLGTFTQEDSVQGGAANPLTMNRFLYALANPATLIDPDGHRACLDTGTSCDVSPELDAQVATRTLSAKTTYWSGGSTWTPPGKDPAPPDMYWSPTPLTNGDYQLLPDTCGQSSDGFFSGTCVDEEELNAILTVYGAGGAGILCVLFCAGLVVSAASSTVAAAATTAVSATATQIGSRWESIAQSIQTYFQGSIATIANMPAASSAGPKLQAIAERYGVSVETIRVVVMTQGQRVRDLANGGNVNVLLQRPDGAGLIRITLNPTSTRIVSAGLIQARNLQNGLASGRFVPLQ